MIKTPIQHLTFEEYLTYDDGTDNRYELVDGELVMVPLPTADHSDVIDLLSSTIKAEIKRLALPWIAKRDAGVYIGTDPETGKDRSRTPDLCVVTTEQWAFLKADKTSAAVLKTPPLLVVEVVSRGSRKTDYKNKQKEYSSALIPEYWIVDLQKSKVSVLVLVNGSYQASEFTSSLLIISKTFPELTLTVEQLLSA